MKTILVTGSNGQLGMCIKDASENTSEMKFIFTNSSTLDITNKEKIDAFFNKNNIDFCINTAAYTNVDKAETEKEQAYAINTQGAENIAKACAKHHVTLIHISTDFVFDGNKKTPYTEEDNTNPQNIYGLTKLQGEQAVQKHCKKHYIIRTSWLYSEYGHNFMKTMLKLAKEKKEEINVVNDQIGTPTSAKDLAKIIVEIITQGRQQYGVYNFSNKGVASWYDFAKAIFEYINATIKVHEIPSSQYPTPVKRPTYSVLDKQKIEKMLGTSTLHWKKSLQKINNKKQA